MIKFHKRLYGIILAGVLISAVASCKKYLDIVPDNIATIDNAFTLESTAERYLFTCYSFMPRVSDLGNNMLLSGDELWLPMYPFPEFSNEGWQIAMGQQNINTPLLDYWDGGAWGPSLWEGIRDCNIFLDHIMSVPGMDEALKEQWAAEAKFLKAYYHFYLLRMYGPIPIMKTDIPISASIKDVRVQREPVDSVFSYIVQLLDEAAPYLPLEVTDQNTELGRITLPIDLGMKAKILVYAASPLFNGNQDYAGFTNAAGVQLFSQNKSTEKWTTAAAACLRAIQVCDSAGLGLYYFQPTTQARNLSDETQTKLNIRNTITERWNTEIIWANTNYGSATLQYQATPPNLDPATKTNSVPRGNLGVSMNMASQFYTKNGLPIDEDRTWDYAGRYSLRTATMADKYNIEPGYTTAVFNFDREPRFYADLGFDGGIWYGQGVFNDSANWYIQGKLGQNQGSTGTVKYSLTGYYAKKYVNYTDVASEITSSYTILEYPWVMLRLGDLYLLYAEALNETSGPSAEVYKYLDLLRARAGVPTVEQSWSQFAKDPSKYTTQDGLRDIIHRERTIEMALEGQRFWDLRRWKTAMQTYNAPITGWDVNQETDANYYRVKSIFQQNFSLRDYFWPIKQYDITVNDDLVQNPGW